MVAEARYGVMVWLRMVGNRFFIILTQYKKLGSLISVYKETQRDSSGKDEVFQVKTIQGKEEPDWELAARFLTEQTNINKPVLYSICLQECSLKTLKALKDIVIKNKLW
ncbi:Protein of unknown function [Gryllus bimaculatus]|nr:Protein of unknown function [Gryllus bimaculatus]